MKEINDRITPIYMGSTGWRLSIRLYQQDHPHIHGEHCFVVHNGLFLPGSPPYTWGARPAVRQLTAVLGITPIYMGSTECLV